MNDNPNVEDSPVSQSRAAMVSFVLGCVSLVSLILAYSNLNLLYMDNRIFMGGVFACLPAIFFSYWGRSDIRRSGGKLGGNSRAVVGVVMGFIVILILILCPPLPQYAVTQARQAQAKSDTRQIVAAIEQYQADYGKPLVAFAGQERSPRDITVGQGVLHNSLLFNTLRSRPVGVNSDSHLNPRGIFFFEGFGVADPAHPRSGFVDQDEAPKDIRGSYFDPWGHEYIIRIHYDGAKPFVAPDGTTVKGNVIAWSAGEDGIPGTADDIVSWK